MTNRTTDHDTIIAWGKEAIEAEGRAVLDLLARIGDGFARATSILLTCEGKVVVSGMGKAGIVAQKCSATLSSTGTPSIWLHLAEALHGDLGRVTEGDVALILSYSGETDELKTVVPFLKKIGAVIIAMTGNPRSFLAQYADVVLDVAVTKEACPLGLAPTSSTTVMLALCDALAIAVQKARGFEAKDFALFHPKGSLGRKLLLRVADCMRTGDALPTVTEEVTVGEALVRITQARAGCCVVVDEAMGIRGIFTDGDLRRGIERDDELTRRPVGEVMTATPVVVHPDALASAAMRVLEERKIDEVPVTDSEGRVVGLLDVKDLLRAGVV